MGRTVQEPSRYSNGVTDMNSRYALTRQQVNDLIVELNTPGFLDNIAKLFSSPIDNIISLYKFPFDVKAQNAVWQVLADDFLIINIVTTTSAKGTFLNPLSMPLLNLGTAQIPRYFNNFMDYAPYTKIELYLPYIGFVTLDNDLVVGNTISIKYAVDLYTGKCTAFVLTGTGANETVIMTRDGNIGMQIQVAGGTGADISRSMLRMGVGAAAGAVSLGAGAVGAGAGVNKAGEATGGTVGSIAGTVSSAAGYMGSTTINAITAAQVNVHKNGSTDANNGFYAPQNAYLIYTRPTVARPSSYDATIGRPSGKTKQLQQLTGFTVVEAVHVEGSGFATATGDELTEIERLLKTGVIL